MNKYKKVPVCIGFLLPVFLIYTIFLFVPLVQSAYYLSLIHIYQGNLGGEGAERP